MGSSPSSSSYFTPPSMMALDMPPEDAVNDLGYRPSIPAPTEVTNLLHIYFDELIYSSALSLITSLATSGTSHPNSRTIPALTPIPLHIEIVSVLLVHPKFTTHASHKEHTDIPARSISVLRSILSNLGPFHASLAEAFSFAEIRSRGARRRHNRPETSSDDDEEEFTVLKGIVANQGRLRKCAKDFWHIVGWAFNCSVVHRKRWKYWKVWLEYMLDVLDADWKEREAQDKADPDTRDPFQLRRGSMLVTYLSGVNGRSSELKRVVDSIFVDGGERDLRVYPEVFTNETLELKQNGQKRKRDDDTEHAFGDYNDEEDDLDYDEETPAPSQETVDGKGSSAPDPWMGGAESIALRQRVMVLLSRVAYFLEDEFVDCVVLYDEYARNIKMLPLPAFSLLFSPSASSNIPTDMYVSLSQFLLSRLLPNNAPRPAKPGDGDGDDLSQEKIERCFLPFAACTSATDDNAMVSILVEGILRLVMKAVRVYHTPCLDAAIEKGILAREAKAKSDRRRRDNRASKKEEEEDRKWLTASGQRLRNLLAWVEAQHYSDEE